MKLAFLGTGSSNSTERNPTAFAISNGKDMIMIDFGGGAYHQIPRLKSSFFSPSLLSTILLTHYHVDHVSGLADYIWGELWNTSGKRLKPLNIAGPTGLKDFWYRRLLPFIDREISFQVNLVELNDSDIYNADFLKAESVKLLHNRISYYTG